MPGVRDDAPVRQPELALPQLLRWPRLRASPARAAISLAPLAIAFAAYLVVFFVMRPATTGDEPHYLLIANSIVLDGDVDLANDYADPERTQPTCNCFPLEPHGYRYTGEGLYPQHGLGLPLLLAPAVAVGGLDLVRLLMVLIAAVLADQLYRLLAQLGIARRAYRWLAWAAVVFCLPLLVFSNQIFPELPGALLVVVAFRVVLLRQQSRRALLVGALACAALPWLNVRYFALAGFLLVCLLYAASRPILGAARTERPRAGLASRSWREVRRRVATLVTRRIDAAVVLLPVAVSAGLLALIFESLYGSPSPDAPFRLSPYELGGAGWRFWYEFLLAEFIDAGIGWIPYAPVHWLGLAGIGCLIWRFGAPAAVVVAAFLVYAAIVASTGAPAGTTFPARYLLVFIPLVAVPLSLVIERVREARLIFFPLLAVSLVISISAVREHEDLYPFALDRGHTARLFGVRSLQTAFPRPRPVPSYLNPTRASVSPGEYPPQTGRAEGAVVVASEARRDRPGLVLWGPYATLAPGPYHATFSLGARAPAGPVALVEVFHLPDQVLAQREVSSSDVGSGRDLRRIMLPFTAPGGVPIETRVFYRGYGELYVGRTQIAPVPGTVRPQPEDTFPDWPLAFLWVAGTALVAVLFVRVVSPHSERPDRREADLARGTGEPG